MWRKHIITKDNNSPITKLKAVKFYELADEEFRIAVFEKLNELQENWKRQLKKII